MVHYFKTDWYWSGKMSQRVKALAHLRSLLETHAMEVPPTPKSCPLTSSCGHSNTYTNYAQIH